MTKTMHRGPPPATPAELADRGIDSLRLGRFKEAIEVFKQLVRQEPRPEWRQRLADAYAGRARSLVDKGMFKEAAIVLENTLTPSGMIRELVLYLNCLIRQGQHQRAARIAQRCVNSGGPDAAQVAEWAAALSLAVPTPMEAAKSGDAGWAELAHAGQAALGAWVQRKPSEEVGALLGRIPLRSSFGPVRLILKSLLARDAPEKVLGLLRMIPAGSVFAGFRAAAEAVLADNAATLLERWAGFSQAQRNFVAEVRGIPPAATGLLQQTLEAERRGPAALLTLLLRPGLPLADDTLRAACLDLLPASPNAIQQFERRFGRLPAPEWNRALALAAEAGGRWSEAQVQWEMMLAPLSDQPGPEVRLKRAVVLSHLADLAERHPEIEARQSDDAVAEYLERSLDADPDHLPTTLRLIEHHREDEASVWHGLAERAARRFPDSTAALMLAVDAAAERDAYKKAVGFARRLLALDPINQPVRQRMIELQLAYARKQMRAGRADLAEKALGQAAEWERPDAASAPLRIARALVACRDQDPAADARLRQAVELAGSGTVGWFRATLEAALMGWTEQRRQPLHRELAAARPTEPERQTILLLVGALGQKEIHKNKKVVKSVLWRIDQWLLQGVGSPLSSAEFQTLAACFHHFDAFDTLRAYAAAVLRREPDDCAARFYRIVAQTRGEPHHLSGAHAEELSDLMDEALDRRDFHMANRIRRFLPVRGFADDDEPGDDFASEALEAMLEEIATGGMRGMPEKEIRQMVNQFGRAATIDRLVEIFGDSPIAEVLSEQQLLQLCTAMVARATSGRPQATRR